MFANLLTTATRRISASHRQIIKCPVKGGEKLTPSALGVYLKKNYKNAAKGGKSSMKVLSTLREQFKTLSQSQLAKYTAVAKANVRKAAARRAVFKQAQMSGYILFVQRNYAKVAKTIKAQPKDMAPMAAKVLSKQWKAQGSSGRAKYNAAAERIRTTAIQQRDRMIAKYSA
ncbi:high mobility group protein [Perkinsela sp. CCAP 1560/4]|nr:high mobility group protein [Perkinsela sp. CCAP 1560/4]|eukprot:KNH05785.1 high mobility group protein [Perkinsela sp. CCAP 1560/4]